MNTGRSDYRAPKPMCGEVGGPTDATPSYIAEGRREGITPTPESDSRSLSVSVCETPGVDATFRVTRSSFSVSDRHPLIRACASSTVEQRTWRKPRSPICARTGGATSASTVCGRRQGPGCGSTCGTTTDPSSTSRRARGGWVTTKMTRFNCTRSRIACRLPSRAVTSPRTLGKISSSGRRVWTPASSREALGSQDGWRTFRVNTSSWGSPKAPPDRPTTSNWPGRGDGGPPCTSLTTRPTQISRSGVACAGVRPWSRPTTTLTPRSQTRTVTFTGPPTRPIATWGASPWDPKRRGA